MIGKISPQTALIARNDNAVAHGVLDVLRQLRPEGKFLLAGLGSPTDEFHPEACVYFPSLVDRQGMMPDLVEAEDIFRQFAGSGVARFILLSSALIYGTWPGRQSMVSETYSLHGTRHRIANGWKSLEELAIRTLREHVRLTILRPVTVVPSATLLARRLAARFSLTIAGYDPVIQLLRVPDLAQAVLCMLEHSEGIFNVAPDSVVPLHTAVRMAGKRRIALPLTWQRIGADGEALDYLRYPWTVSNQKIKQELGFSPGKSTAAARPGPKQRLDPEAPASEPAVETEFDEFGLDTKYIEWYSKRLFEFASRYYWRIETQGLEHIPRDGPVVLVGMHRGFVPMDGIMAVHLVLRETGRVPRFLAHPGLLKLPFIARFVAKMGGVLACEESAGRVLESGGMLGVFPEGVRGAFSLCREAYRLQDFGRNSFVKLALRHRAPILPFVTAGSAEVFPILARIKSRRWTRWTDWPWLPLSTFPLIPFPLPSKWHMRFLPPISMKEYPQGRESSALKTISAEVRTKMQNAVDEIIQRRRSIFYGSAFC